MDREKKKKLRNIRVLMTNIFMALSVIAIVAIFMLIAMGYSIGENGSIEQSGLIKFNSNPTGATVEIDNETQLARTDTSKMLSSGTHSIKITKSGYDTWHKDLTIDVGLLTTIDWIRLFPLNPSITDIATFNDFRIVSISPDRKNFLIAESNSNTLSLINAQGESLKYTNLSLSSALSTTKNLANDGSLNVVSWSDNNSEVLLTYTTDKQTSWHLVDLSNVDNSINLTQKFNLNFSSILLANDSASKLWAIEDGKLHIIDTATLTLSSAIADNVVVAANNDSSIAFITSTPPKDDETTDTDNNNTTDSSLTSTSDTKKQYSLYIFKEGEDGSTEITTLENYNSNTLLAMGTYWDSNWLAYNIDNQITLYNGSYPSYGKSTSSFKNSLNFELSFTPQTISCNTDERIFAFADAQNIFTYDIETKNHATIATDNVADNSINWLDSYILWENANDKIVIRDFDGDNRREIISNHNNSLPIMISQNNKWLYYFERIEVITTNDSATKDDIDINTAASSSETSTTEYVLKREKLNV